MLNCLVLSVDSPYLVIRGHVEKVRGMRAFPQMTESEMCMMSLEVRGCGSYAAKEYVCMLPQLF